MFCSSPLSPPVAHPFRGEAFHHRTRTFSRRGTTHRAPEPHHSNQPVHTPLTLRFQPPTNRSAPYPPYPQLSIDRGCPFSSPTSLSSFSRPGPPMSRYASLHSPPESSRSPRSSRSSPCPVLHPSAPPPLRPPLPLQAFHSTCPPESPVLPYTPCSNDPQPALGPDSARSCPPCTSSFSRHPATGSLCVFPGQSFLPSPSPSPLQPSRFLDRHSPSALAPLSANPSPTAP